MGRNPLSPTLQPRTILRSLVSRTGGPCRTQSPFVGGRGLSVPDAARDVTSRQTGQTTTGHSGSVAPGGRRIENCWVNRHNDTPWASTTRTSWQRSAVTLRVSRSTCRPHRRHLRVPESAKPVAAARTFGRARRNNRRHRIATPDQGPLPHGPDCGYRLRGIMSGRRSELKYV